MRGLSDADIRQNEQVLNQDIKRIGEELTQGELIYVIDRTGQRVHLVSRESGGPPIRSSPQKSGFGSRLIKIMFEGQIGGSVEKLRE